MSVPSHTLIPAALCAGLLAACARPQVAPSSPSRGPVLTAQDIEHAAPGQPIEQLLMDRFPGVDVQRVGADGISIRIRGPASFMSEGEPLIVVDGVALGQDMHGLAWLNPHDIADIRVLKDPSETALYGLRGANGVILVSTKRPSR